MGFNDIETDSAVFCLQHIIPLIGKRTAGEHPNRIFIFDQQDGASTGQVLVFVFNDRLGRRWKS